MISLRLSDDRGRARFSWLDSKHSFSFGNYYDPAHMGFSKLRVINDDTVKPGAGFGTHGHRDMEIISLVLEGCIEHRDSEGNIETLPPGEFQLMSAGQGVTHSEYNASKVDRLRFLQIWIEPNERGGKPGYQQKSFGQKPGLTTIATPTGKANTLKIRQNCYLHQLILDPDAAFELSVNKGRKVYVHIFVGSMQINDHHLDAGDGAKISDIQTISFSNGASSKASALVFDLP